MTSFGGLSTALSGLYTARRGLDVTGQNIANANTAGYSRQRVDLASVGAPAVPALWSRYEGAGSGVAVTGTTRMGDEFLTARSRTESGLLAEFTGRQETLAGVETAFAEPGDTGLQSQLADMWSAWHDVANRPGDLAARAQLLSSTSTAADGIRQAYDALDARWTAGREQLEATVTSINNTARTVAELNQAILRDTQAGIPANELKDQRDTLVDQLVQLTGAQMHPGQDGSVDVFVGGTALVRGNSSLDLAVAGAHRMEESRTGGADPVSIVWAASGSAATPGGRAGAQAEGLAVTLPGYADELDAVVARLRDTVNAAHTAGYDLDGNPGRNVFDPAATAKDVTLLLDDPRQVAASAEAPGPDGPSLDGSNAAGLAELERRTDGADATYRQMIVRLGAAAQTANRRVEIQGKVAEGAEAAREAQAGVNIDEEMVGLLTFQRAYEAAARVISTVDATLDTLINRTGLVGR